MNSYIRLKNGLIINLSQIETCGPLLPYKLTYRGVCENEEDIEKIENGTFDIPNKIAEYGSDANIEMLKNQIFCVPSDSPVNDIYNAQKPETITFIPQQYMLLLKSGRIILLTQSEYNNICNVMEFDNNYSNIDYKYAKFN